MAKRGRKKKEAVTVGKKRRITRIIVSIILIIIAALGLFGTFGKAGILGDQLTTFTKEHLGTLGTFVTSLIVLILGIRLINKKSIQRPLIDSFFALMAIVSLLGVLDFMPWTEQAGGTLGAYVATYANMFMGVFVGAIILLAVAALSILLLVKRHRTRLDWLFRFFERSDNPTAAIKIRNIDDRPKSTTAPSVDEPEKEKKAIAITGITKKKKPPTEEELTITMPGNIMASEYIYPPLSLLSKSKGKPNVGDINANARTIEETLQNFNINVTMDEASVGPTVTRYALKPDAGVRLSKIIGLQNNLELALAASVRIEAPIHGKSLVGIEIPNKTKSMIGLGSILDEKEYTTSAKPLLFSLGKSVTGDTLFVNLAKLPHLLIAGATGSGKSVTVHNIIVSLLYRNGPEMLRFIMVDPKRVELPLYNNIPHLLTPVIKEAKKAILALKWATKEMERRYDILESQSVRDISSYHENIVEPAYRNIETSADIENNVDLPERMPYIVVVIDELADLMQAYPRELESSIVRLAQMSRAVGIHLILSTQRPSVNVITGLIKANVPARIALRVASQIDSRTIMDTMGAEKLLGAGDMLFSGGEVSKPTRVQCPYITEEEVKKVAEYVTKSNMHILTGGEIELPETMDGDRAIAHGSFEDDNEDNDPLYEDAKATVIKVGKASTSFLQRKLRVGYSRAARLIDILEERGVVGPQNGSKPRDVLTGHEDTSVNASDATDDESSASSGDHELSDEDY
ncbi:MAG: S-DNA-T family DNA segregation ATPase FtsK/SpoIIIE [Planctomycetota bacterium]|jgi:S-DNA-T family DNA segregation ATPase FtsK/SpoIIIE